MEPSVVKINLNAWIGFFTTEPAKGVAKERKEAPKLLHTQAATTLPLCPLRRLGALCGKKPSPH